MNSRWWHSDNCMRSYLPLWIKTTVCVSGWTRHWWEGSWEVYIFFTNQSLILRVHQLHTAGTTVHNTLWCRDSTHIIITLRIAYSAAIHTLLLNVTLCITLHLPQRTTTTTTTHHHLQTATCHPTVSAVSLHPLSGTIDTDLCNGWSLFHFFISNSCSLYELIFPYVSLNK